MQWRSHVRARSGGRHSPHHGKHSWSASSAPLPLPENPAPPCLFLTSVELVLLRATADWFLFFSFFKSMTKRRHFGPVKKNKKNTPNGIVSYSLKRKKIYIWWGDRVSPVQLFLFTLSVPLKTYLPIRDRDQQRNGGILNSCLGLDG